MPPDRPRGNRPPSYAALTESQRRKARGAVGDPPADANAGPSRSAPSTGSPTSIYSRPKKVVPYSSPTGPRLGTTIKVRNLTLARHTGAANSHHQKGQTEELVMGSKPVGHVPKSNKPTGMFEMAPLSVPAKVLPPGAREAAQQLLSQSYLGRSRPSSRGPSPPSQPHSRSSSAASSTSSASSTANRPMRAGPSSSSGVADPPAPTTSLSADVTSTGRLDPRLSNADPGPAAGSAPASASTSLSTSSSNVADVERSVAGSASTSASQSRLPRPVGRTADKGKGPAVIARRSTSSSSTSTTSSTSSSEAPTVRQPPSVFAPDDLEGRLSSPAHNAEPTDTRSSATHPALVPLSGIPVNAQHAAHLAEDAREDRRELALSSEMGSDGARRTQGPSAGSTTAETLLLTSEQVSVHVSDSSAGPTAPTAAAPQQRDALSPASSSRSHPTSASEPDAAWKSTRAVTSTPSAAEPTTPQVPSADAASGLLSAQPQGSFVNAALGLTAALTFNPSTSTPTPTPPPDASRLPVVGASAASAVVNARKVVEPAKAGTPPSSLVVSGPIPPALAHLWRSLSDSTTSMVDVWNSIGAVIASLEDSHGGQVPHSAGSSARTATGAEEVEKDLLDDVLWGEMVTELRKELKCLKGLCPRLAERHSTKSAEGPSRPSPSSATDTTEVARPYPVAPPSQLEPAGKEESTPLPKDSISVSVLPARPVHTPVGGLRLDTADAGTGDSLLPTDGDSDAQRSAQYDTRDVPAVMIGFVPAHINIAPSTTPSVVTTTDQTVSPPQRALSRQPGASDASKVAPQGEKPASEEEREMEREGVKIAHGYPSPASTAPGSSLAAETTGLFASTSRTLPSPYHAQYRAKLEGDSSAPTIVQEPLRLDKPVPADHPSPAVSSSTALEVTLGGNASGSSPCGAVSVKVDTKRSERDVVSSRVRDDDSSGRQVVDSKQSEETRREDEGARARPALELDLNTSSVVHASLQDEVGDPLGRAVQSTQTSSSPAHEMQGASCQLQDVSIRGQDDRVGQLPSSSWNVPADPSNSTPGAESGPGEEVDDATAADESFTSEMDLTYSWGGIISPVEAVAAVPSTASARQLSLGGTSLPSTGRDPASAMGEATGQLRREEIEARPAGLDLGEQEGRSDDGEAGVWIEDVEGEEEMVGPPEQGQEQVMTAVPSALSPPIADDDDCSSAGPHLWDSLEFPSPPHVAQQTVVLGRTTLLPEAPTSTSRFLIASSTPAKNDSHRKKHAVSGGDDDDLDATPRARPTPSDPADEATPRPGPQPSALVDGDTDNDETPRPTRHVHLVRPNLASLPLGSAPQPAASAAVASTRMATRSSGRPVSSGASDCGERAGGRVSRSETRSASRLDSEDGRGEEYEGRGAAVDDRGNNNCASGLSLSFALPAPSAQRSSRLRRMSNASDGSFNSQSTTASEAERQSKSTKQGPRDRIPSSAELNLMQVVAREILSFPEGGMVLSEDVQVGPASKYFKWKLGRKPIFLESDRKLCSDALSSLPDRNLLALVKRVHPDGTDGLGKDAFVAFVKNLRGLPSGTFKSDKYLVPPTSATFPEALRLGALTVITVLLLHTVLDFRAAIVQWVAAREPGLGKDATFEDVLALDTGVLKKKYGSLIEADANLNAEYVKFLTKTPLPQVQ